ncbi:sensor histidine kinase [Paenibacillus sp. PAMC21692]|uniref:sensor histidine kinase n=1 Tax=Paenibacillus sp. PAMC21692 TaxID=2762320 RepID=UPI00164E542E|nr:sensor histidine kinase [Paenibacillus sp. PAMC21692]QNK58115.1 GHKL domain-containing protein [Paenibacillus sp. PAMC21692]
MIYLSIVLLLLTIAFTYKRLNSLSTYFLYGIIIGWLLSFFSYIFYISSFNVYFEVVSKFYDFSPGSWNRLVLENFNPSVQIRLMNAGVILFSYSFLLFSVSYTMSRRKLKNLAIYIPIGILALFQLLYFDPAINLSLQNRYYDAGYPQTLAFNEIRDIINAASMVLKHGVVIVAFVLLFIHFFRNVHVKFLRRYMLYHLLCLIPVAVIHTIMFYWAPKVLVKATFIREFHNYLKPQTSNIIYDINIFPIVSIVALGTMIFTFSRYHSMEVHYRNVNADINKRIKTASLGVKAFTHSIKNHLLAIKSEAEYLKEKLADDREALYSLDLIMNSCLMSYETLNSASSKLNSISLTMELAKLHVPVEKALATLASSDSRVSIQVIRESLGSKAYMDIAHMSEVCCNIITNALESLKGQSDGEIVITIEDRDQWGAISIQDNGPGIPTEHINDVFSPFFSTKASSSNWGVGLSYCHKIVTAHNGKIEVESNDKKGTTFTFFLPLV